MFRPRKGKTFRSNFLHTIYTTKASNTVTFRPSDHLKSVIQDVEVSGKANSERLLIGEQKSQNK